MSTRQGKLSVWVRGLIAAAAALILDSVVYLIALANGASMIVDQGGQELALGYGGIVAAAVLPLALGGVIVWLLVRWKPVLWTWFAWIGLVFAVASSPASVVAAADTATGVSLATMQVIAGVVWFAALMIGRTRTAATTAAELGS